MIVDEAEGLNQLSPHRNRELNNLIVLVEFLLKFTSNNGFQLFLDVLLNFAPEKVARIELSFKIEVCVRAHQFFQ